MRSVGLKLLKNKLSEYVRWAARGETILITDRERVVAEIVPAQTTNAAVSDDSLLAEDVREGWLTPASRPGGSLPARNPIMTLKQLLKKIEVDRADNNPPR